MGDPHAIDEIEGFDALRQHAAHEHANLGLGGTLIFPQLREPGVAPIPGPLGLPQNRTAELSARALDALDDIAAELSLRHRFDAVEWKFRAQQGLQFQFLNFALKLLRAPIRLVLQFLDGPLHRQNGLILLEHLLFQRVLRVAQRFAADFGKSLLDTPFDVEFQFAFRIVQLTLLLDEPGLRVLRLSQLLLACLEDLLQFGQLADFGFHLRRVRQFCLS